MSAPKYEWDYDYWPPHRQPTIEYTQDRRGTYVPRRHRRPLGFGWCLILVTGVAVLLLRFFWPALLMAAVMLDIHTPGEMAAVAIGAIVLGAAWLRGRRF